MPDLVPVPARAAGKVSRIVRYLKPDVQTEAKAAPGWKPKREAPIPGAAPQGNREPKVRKVQIKEG